MLLKRILSAALAAAAILAFAGCGKSSDSSAKAESSQTETQQQTTEQTTTAKSATTNASADKTAEKPVPGKLYALNQDEGDAPAISALKLNGNQVGTEEGVNGWKASADKIRFVFEQSEWIELYPQTEQTSGLAAYLVPHSDDAATYTDKARGAGRCMGLLLRSSRDECSRLLRSDNHIRHETRCDGHGQDLP